MIQHQMRAHSGIIFVLLFLLVSCVWANDPIQEAIEFFGKENIHEYAKLEINHSTQSFFMEKKTADEYTSGKMLWVIKTQQNELFSYHFYKNGTDTLFFTTEDYYAVLAYNEKTYLQSVVFFNKTKKEFGVIETKVKFISKFFIYDEILYLTPKVGGKYLYAIPLNEARTEQKVDKYDKIFYGNNRYYVEINDEKYVIDGLAVKPSIVDENEITEFNNIHLEMHF